jgi:AcrR family transcriptional regulator
MLNKEVLDVPRTGRRPGPTDTRAQILSAAAARFSASGYEPTTVRGVAADAGVDPALIRRFYGSKEQLFTEIAASVIRPEDIATLLGGPGADLGERLARYFLGLLGDIKQPGPLLALVRSAVTNEHAAALMRQFLAREVLGRIAVVLGVDHADLRAALAASQLVGLAVARYAVGLEALVATDSNDLVGWVAPVLQRYFTGPAPKRRPATSDTTHQEKSHDPVHP